MRINYSITMICICLLSCESGSKSEEPVCGTYYLNSVGPNTEVYYNSDHLISEYVSGVDTLFSFEYNDDKQIKHRKGLSIDVYYHYDETKRLKYFLEYKNSNFLDSITFQFNTQNLISRITYYEITAIHFTLTAVKMIEYEYVNRNSSQAKFYEVDYDNFPNLKLSSTYRYEYDDKQLPYPKETWPFNAIYDDGSISENNVTKEVSQQEGKPEYASSYTYNYNKAGFPIERKLNGVITDEYNYSCEARLRGQK